MCVLMSYSFGDYEFLEGCVPKVYITFLFVGSTCDIYTYFHQLMNTGMLNMIHHLNNRPTYIYIYKSTFCENLKNFVGLNISC